MRLYLLEKHLKNTYAHTYFFIKAQGGHVWKSDQLKKLPDEVKNKIFPYFKEFLALIQDNILSIVIYGSACGSDYLPKISDINSLVIFRQFEFSKLKKSLEVIARGISKRITAPLVLTKEDIQASVDIFPIEFLEMKENHVLIYGEDVLTSLDIPQKYLRLFCEQQVKGKLIRIRQAYLDAGLHHKRMEGLLKDSLTTLMPIFRTLLRLKGKAPPVNKLKILEELCGEFQLDQDIFKTIYRNTTQEEKIVRCKIDFFIEEYLKELRKLARAVDRI